jgi:hypothetical protein
MKSLATANSCSSAGVSNMYDDIRYSQRSQELPLDDREFELTDLSTWRELHPETTVVYPTP